MANDSNIEPKDNKDLEKEGSVSEISEQAKQKQESSYESRKKNLSKREIMEELSRARFPWDE